MARAAVDPVGIQAQRHRLGVGPDHHVVEFPSREQEFDVVIVVSQFHAEACQFVAQLVERRGLRLQLLVALALTVRTGVGHDDLRSDLFGPLGQRDDPFQFLVDVGGVGQGTACIDRTKFEVLLGQLGGQAVHLVGRAESRLQAVDSGRGQPRQFVIECDFCVLLVPPADRADRPLVDRHV